MPRDTSPTSMLAGQLRDAAKVEGGPSGIDKNAVDVAAISQKSREEVSELTDAMNDYIAAIKSAMSENFSLSKSEKATDEQRKNAAKNLGKVNKQYKEAIKYAKSLGVSVKDNRNNVVDFGKSLSALSKNFQTATKSISPAVWERLAKAHKQNSDVVKKMRQDYEAAKGEYTENAKRLQGLQVEITGLLVEMNRLQKAQESSNNMSEQERKEIDSKINSVGKSIEILGKEEKKYRKRQEAIGENIDTIKGFVSSQNEAIESEEELSAKSTFLGKIQANVRQEVEGLSGGLGEQAVGATAAAVAFVYLGEKIQEYGDKILDIQKNWADYTVQAQLASRTTPDFSGGINAVNELRQELSLTREESVGFQKALKQGALAGVSSTTELIEAAKQLTATFGDDPTERLQNYVGLLQTIPTLQTDLSVTASLDDQATAWFALAEQGKVSQAIELQMAGLLGGEMEMPEDQMEAAVESLKTQREMATTMENIEQTLAQYIPEQTALLTKSVGSIAQGVGTIVGIYTGIGVLGTLTKRIANRGPKGTNDAVEDVERAVRSQSSRRTTKRLPRTTRAAGRARTAIGGVGRKLGGVGQKALGGVGRKLGGVGQKAYGGALKTFGSHLGKVTGLLKPFGSVASKVISSLGSFGGTLGSVASTIVGAISPVVGTAVVALGTVAAATGSFVVAFGGAATLLGMYGEEAGDALQDFGNRVKDDGGKAASRFEKGLYTILNGPFNALEDVLGIDVLPNIEDFGKMLSTSGKFWSDFADDAYEYLFVSEAEREAKQKAINEYKKEKELRNEVAAASKRTQKSALAMEESLNLIKAASESPITALSKLGQEVAQMEMEEFTIVGGTVGDFNRALSEGVSATSKELEQMDKAFAKARKKIIEDSDMTAEHRRAALLKLHKAEMEATKVFIDGMMNLIGRFESIPEVASEELRIGMRKVAQELTMDVGVGIFGDASETFVENIRSSMGALSAATEQLATDFENQRKASEMVASRLEIDTASVGQELSTYRKDVMTAASDMTKAEREKDVKLIDELQKAVSSDDATKAEEVMVGLTESIDKIQAEMNTLAETDLAIAASKATLEYGSANKEMLESYKTLQELVKKGAESVDEMKALDEQRKKVADLAEKVAQSGDKLTENEKALKAIAAERLKIDEASITKEQLAKIKKQVQEEIKKKNELGRQLIALEQSRAIAEKIVMGASQGTFSLQASKKSLDAMNERMQGFLQSINSLAERIENDPFVQSIQRAIDALERQTDLELRLGNSATAVTDLVEKRQEKIERQLQVAKENEQILRDMAKGGELQARQLDAVGNTLSALAETVDKNLDFSKLGNEAQKKLQESLGMGTKEIEQVIDKQAQDVLSAYDALSEAAKSGAGPEELKQLGARYMEAQKSFSGTLSEARTAIQEAGGYTGNIEQYEKQMKTATLAAQVVVEGTEKQLEINKAQQTNLRAQWHETFDELDRNINSLRDSLFQKTAAASIEAANANAELAKSHLDVIEATNAYNKGIQSTEKAYNDILARITERQAETVAKLNAEIARAESSGKQERIIALRLKKEEMIAKFANERAKAEQEMLSSTAQMRDNLQEAAMATLDFRKQEVDVQLDLAQSMGASMGHIFDLQMEQLSLARQERDVKKQLLEEAIEQNRKGAKNEEEIAKRRLEYAKSAAEVQKKALGAQRDAYDKLLEKSFGAIRSSRGARRQVMTTAQQFGRGFVQNQSTGLVVAGKAQSLVQRQAAAASIADAWNKGNAPSKSEERTDDALSAANKQQTAAEINHDAANIIHEAAGGLERAAQQYGKDVGMEGAPKAKRHPAEDKLETSLIEEEVARGNKAAEETAKASERGASASQDIADAGTTPGSLYTHDVNIENLLKKIHTELTSSEEKQRNFEEAKQKLEEAKNTDFYFPREMSEKRSLKEKTKEQKAKISSSESNVKSAEDNFERIADEWRKVQPTADESTKKYYIRLAEAAKERWEQEKKQLSEDKEKLAALQQRKNELKEIEEKRLADAKENFEEAKKLRNESVKSLEVLNKQHEAYVKESNDQYSNEISILKARVAEAKAIGDTETVKKSESDIDMLQSAMGSGQFFIDFQEEIGKSSKSSKSEARLKLEKDYETRAKDSDYFTNDAKIKKAKDKYSNETLKRIRDAARQEAVYMEKADKLRSQNNLRGASAYEKMAIGARDRKERNMSEYSKAGQLLGVADLDILKNFQKAQGEGVTGTGLGGDNLAQIERGFVRAINDSGINVTQKELQKLAILGREAISEERKTKSPREKMSEAPPRPEVSDRPEPPRTKDEIPSARQQSADVSSPKTQVVEQPISETRSTVAERMEQANNAVPPPSTQTTATETQTEEKSASKASLRAKDMNVNVELSFTVDKNGNIVPVVKNIMKSELPNALKTPDSQSALEQSGFVKT